LSVSHELKSRLHMLKQHKHNLKKIQKQMDTNLSELKAKVQWESDPSEDSSSSDAGSKSD
jgi:chaperonin cofactor prefoldin